MQALVEAQRTQVRRSSEGVFWKRPYRLGLYPNAEEAALEAVQCGFESHGAYVSCIGFTNPTMRQQIASQEACDAKLSWPVPEYIGKRRMIRLAEQALDSSYKVRAIAAAHPDLPMAYVLLLSMDSSPEVRRHIAMSKSATKDLLERMLVREKDEDIKLFLKWRLDKGW